MLLYLIRLVTPKKSSARVNKLAYASWELCIGKFINLHRQLFTNANAMY